jgi:hypothetical protein
MMKCFASRWGLGAAFVLLGVASLVDAPKAQAQASSMTTAAPPKFIGGDAHTKAPKVAPPAALPGAQSNPDEVAPRASIDLPPNQALFDAINRGDITVARDAIGRGADLDAHNVLGMTPLDLSVDLGRNDITFLLLSMRGSAPPPASADAPTLAAGKGKGKGKQDVVASKVAPKLVTRTISESKTAPAPVRQFVSTDPGTPAPKAGFLGFDGAAAHTQTP